MASMQEPTKVKAHSRQAQTKISETDHWLLVRSLHTVGGKIGSNKTVTIKGDKMLKSQTNLEYALLTK